MTQGLVAPPLDFGGTPSMCVVVSNREKPMNTAASSFTARNNAKRAAEKMIANGKAPAVDYGIRPRDDGRFEIVWKTAPTNADRRHPPTFGGSARPGGNLTGVAMMGDRARAQAFRAAFGDGPAGQRHRPAGE